MFVNTFFGKSSESSEDFHNVLHIVGSTRPVVAVLGFIVKQNVKGVFAEVLLRSAVRNDGNSVPVHARQVLCKPIQLHRSYGFVVGFASALGKPADNCEVIACSLQGVQLASQSAEAEQRFGILVRVGVVISTMLLLKQQN